MMRFILALLTMLATPLWADEVTDQLNAEARAMIDAHDIDGFRSAITAAHADDLAARGDQNRQRALFGPFGVTDPRVAAFTADWLAAEPDSPYALTARVWYLRAMGWAVRGDDLPRFTWHQAMDEMGKLHGDAMQMALRARDLATDLVAASDAVIRMGQSFGMADLAEAELARIMAIAPNHGSLQRAANSLSPKWGGSVDAIARTCEDYALLIPDVPGYTVDICLVELFNTAGVRGPAQAWGWQMLSELPDHPQLIYARMTKAVNNRGDTPERVAAFKAYLAAGGRDFRAAWHLDIDQAGIDPGAESVVPDFVAREVARLAEDLTHDAGNPSLVRDYLDMVDRLDDADQSLAVPREQILRDLLAIAPHNVPAWAYLASMQARGGGVEGLRRYAPFAANAIAYANHKPAVLSQMIKVYGWNYPGVTDADRPGFLQGLAAGQSPEFLEAVACPYLRMTRVLLEVCEAEGLGPDNCRDSASTYQMMLDDIAEITSHGLCQTESNARIEDLLYTPVAIP
jgi:hypothetical protein